MVLWRSSPGRAVLQNLGTAWAKFPFSPPSAHRCSPLLPLAMLVLLGNLCARMARSLLHLNGPGDGEAVYLSGQDVGRGLPGCRRKKPTQDTALKPQPGQAETHWGQLNCKVPNAAVPARTDGCCWAQGCLEPPCPKRFCSRSPFHAVQGRRQG